MTYEEKLAELERLKAEIADRPQFLTSWDSLSSFTERSQDDFEPTELPRFENPLVVAESERQRLFPSRPTIERIEPGTCVGRGGLPDVFVQLMYRSYRAGKSLKEVGRIYKRSRQAVHDIFKRRGFKLRKDSKAKARIEFTYKGLQYSPSKGGYLRATSGHRRLLNHVIWEEFHGPIPPGHQVAFKDGNNRNFDLNNLECLPVTDILARGRSGENGATKQRRILSNQGAWTPKPPAAYDLAFHRWFSKHGWLIHESLGQFSVWTNADAICRFRVNALMIERLAHAGLLVSCHPPKDPSVTHWGLPQRLIPES